MLRYTGSSWISKGVVVEYHPFEQPAVVNDSAIVLCSDSTKLSDISTVLLSFPSPLPVLTPLGWKKYQRKCAFLLLLWSSANAFSLTLCLLLLLLQHRMAPAKSKTTSKCKVAVKASSSSNTTSSGYSLCKWLKTKDIPRRVSTRIATASKKNSVKEDSTPSAFGTSLFDSNHHPSLCNDTSHSFCYLLSAPPGCCTARRLVLDIPSALNDTDSSGKFLHFTMALFALYIAFIDDDSSSVAINMGRTGPASSRTAFDDISDTTSTLLFAASALNVHSIWPSFPLFLHLDVEEYSNDDDSDIDNDTLLALMDDMEARTAQAIAESSAFLYRICFILSVHPHPFIILIVSTDDMVSHPTLASMPLVLTAAASASVAVSPQPGTFDAVTPPLRDFLLESNINIFLLTPKEWVFNGSKRTGSVLPSNTLLCYACCLGCRHFSLATAVAHLENRGRIRPIIFFFLVTPGKFPFKLHLGP